MTEQVLSGRVHEAVRTGMERLERAAGAKQRALLGQVLGRALLATGQLEQAEELFHRQLKLYEALSRPLVRWMSALDRGMLSLSLNRPGRAAEMFNVVADDTAAPPELRVEALAGLATALNCVGEHRTARRTLEYAAAQARALRPGSHDSLLQAIQLELTALRVLRSFEDSGGTDESGEASPRNLRVRLMEASHALQHVPIVAHRLQLLCALVADNLGSASAAGPVLESLNWLRERRLAGVEETSRIEAALAFVGHSDVQHTLDALGHLACDETQVNRHRRSLELKYCMSRLHALNGRHAEALRLYRAHATQALLRLRTELAQVPYSRFLEKQEMVDRSDAVKLQLPLRYRRAYQFIIEHLDDRDLSIQQVAAHVDVTARALQMAFRTHLGMTPAELVRRARMEHIRTELRHGGQRDGVLQVATRWGMSNRSTLAQNYRRQYDETPTSILRGTAAAPSKSLAAAGGGES